MPEGPQPDTLSLEQERQIDAVCQRFEAAWQSSERPVIEEHLGGVPPECRAGLLAELVKLDVCFRRSAGEQPTLDDYRARFPDDTELLRKDFASTPDNPNSARHPIFVGSPMRSLAARSWPANAIVEYRTHQPARHVEPEERERPADDVLTTGPYEPPTSLRGPPGEFVRGARLANRYELERVLGRGGMGEVYLGRDIVLDRHVAVKLIRPRDPSLRERSLYEDGLREMFTGEARIGANLTHPAIATVHDFGFHEGEPFIVFEYIAGETLGELIRRRAPLPLEDARLIIGPLAQALDFAHAHHIVHRDLKPENVRATAQGHFKILDLGLAKEFRRHTDWRFAGTPAYASPEQAAGLPCDGRTDQYALALIAYEMLTGHRPFETADPGELLRMVREQAPLSLRVFVPDIPNVVCTALLRALRKDPNQRFAFCEEFARVLGCTFLSVPTPPPEIRALVAMTELSGHFESRSPTFSFLDFVDGLWRTAESSQAIGAKQVHEEWVLRRSKVLAAVTADALWLWSGSETLRLPWESIAKVHENEDGMTLTLQIITAEGAVEQRLVFPGTGPCTQFSEFLHASISRKPAGSAPRVIEPPQPVVLLSRHPSTPYQVLGEVEFQDTVRHRAEVGLRLRAAMMGADAVLDIREEDLPGFDATVRRVSGTAIKAVDTSGRIELRSFWYAGQTASLSWRLMAVALLPLGCLTALYQTGATIPDAWIVPLVLGSCWPLMAAVLLRASLWPQLVRPAVVAAVSAGLGVALLSLPVCIDLVTGSPVAGAWAVQFPRRLLRFRRFWKWGLLPLAAAIIALIGFAVLIGERAWRVHREYRHATNTATRRTPLLRRLAEWLAMAASVATAVLAAVVVAVAIMAACQRARSRPVPRPSAAETTSRVPAVNMVGREAGTC